MSGGGWNTIESDAGVFTSLIESLGVRDVQFAELLALDPAELLALRPVYGVVFLFRYPGRGDEPPPRDDDGGDGVLDGGATTRLFFAAQTMTNACATQALLGVLLNQPTSAVDVGPALRRFRDFAMALPPDLRGDALAAEHLIRATHNAFARSNPFAVDETAPTTTTTTDDDDDAFHFVAYTAVDGTLYELDGLQPAPISHGPCDGGDEGFARRVVDVLRRRVARYDASEIRFNLLAVCRDRRLRARELGDDEMLARETERRREWRFENALRRHNFVAFAAEVLSGVAHDRLRRPAAAAADGPGHGHGRADDGIHSWVAESLQRREAAEKAMRRRGDEDTEMS